MFVHIRFDREIGRSLTESNQAGLVKDRTNNTGPLSGPHATRTSFWTSTATRLDLFSHRFVGAPGQGVVPMRPMLILEAFSLEHLDSVVTRQPMLILDLGP